MKKTIIFSILIILIAVLFSAVLYSHIPNQMISHWNFAGEPDGYMPKYIGLFLMPLISIAALFLFILLPKIDPLKKNVKKFENYYYIFIFVFILFLFYLHIVSILLNLGINLNIIHFIIPGFTALLYFMGFLTEKAKQNWFIGIKTPWTLSNEQVWNKTHKLGGLLFKCSAAIALFGLIFPIYAPHFIIAPLILSIIFLFFYSYWVYRNLNLK